MGLEHPWICIFAAYPGTNATTDTEGHLDMEYITLIFFLPVPVAYESSQVRGRIAATAANLHHSRSKARSEPRL